MSELPATWFISASLSVTTPMTELPDKLPASPTHLIEPEPQTGLSLDDTQPAQPYTLDDTQPGRPIRTLTGRFRLLRWVIPLGGLGLMILVAGTLLVVAALNGEEEVTSFTVTIQTDAGSYTVQTEARTVAELLAVESIPLGQGDSISPDPSTPIEDNLLIQVTQAQTVALTVDGETQILHTRNARPADVLAEAGVVPGPADRVYLDGDLVEAAELETITNPALNIAIQRGSLVTIRDGVSEYQLSSQGLTVGDVLFEAEISLFLADSVTPDVTTPLEHGMTITITRSKPLSIIVDGERIETRTAAATIGQAVSEAGIVLSGLDYTFPAADRLVTANTSVRVIRVTEELLTEQQVIDYGTVYQADAELALDTRRVLQAGQNGIIQRAIRVRYENGVEVERLVASEEQIQQAQDQVIAYGTNIIIRTLNTPEGPVEYWRKLRVYATSYHPAALGGDNVTSIGAELKRGVVAIDPDIIPYRTNVYVEGYGRGIAADTGAPRRNPYWIDLGYSDADYVGWHRWVDVYLLTPVPANINYLLPLRAEGGPVP